MNIKRGIREAIAAMDDTKDWDTVRSMLLECANLPSFTKNVDVGDGVTLRCVVVPTMNPVVLKSIVGEALKHMDNPQ